MIKRIGVDFDKAIKQFTMQTFVLMFLKNACGTNVFKKVAMQNLV